METIILKEELLPDMLDISEYYIFQQDIAPAHRAKETVDLLQPKHQLLSRQHRLPNVPDLNLVDYKVWLVLQEQVYKVMSCTSVSRLYGMNLTSVLLTRRSSSGGVAHPPKSLCRGQRWPL